MGWKDRLIPPPPGKIVILPDGKQVNVLDVGAGRPIVLVHGFPGSAYDWGDLPMELANRGYRAISYDRVGYAHSSRRSKGEAHTIKHNAQDLMAMIKVLELDDPVLAGWSYGGGVVQEAVTELDAKPPALILIASIGPGFQTTKTPSCVALTIMNWIFKLPGLGFPFAKSVFGKIFPEPLPDSWLHTAHSFMVQAGTVTTVAAEAADMDVASLQPDAINVPTVVIHGREDKNVPFKVGEDIAQRIPGAKLSELPRACHMLPVSDPIELACQMDEFIRDVTPVDPPGVG